MRDPEGGYQKRNVVWSHVSVFAAEIDQFRPSAIQLKTAIESLKSKLDERDNDSVASYQIQALEDEVARLDYDDESVGGMNRQRIMSWGSGLFGSLAHDTTDVNTKRSCYEPC